MGVGGEKKEKENRAAGVREDTEKDERGEKETKEKVAKETWKRKKDERREHGGWEAGRSC